MKRSRRYAAFVAMALSVGAASILMTTLTLDDGSTQSGLVAREDAQNVFLRNAANLEGRGLPVPVARIKDRKDSTSSLMPEGLVAALRLTQIDSLLAFLATGK